MTENKTTENGTEDFYANPAKHSESSGVVAGSTLNADKGSTTREHADVDPHPDRRGVVVGRPDVDPNDPEAVANALANGDRGQVDVSRMSLQERMRYGLLTKEDDEARVRGELGNYATTGLDADRDNEVGPTNVGDGLAGRDNKGR